MSRRVFVLLSLLLLCSSTASAQANPTEAAAARSFPTPPVRAWAALVMDASAGTVMAAVNAHLRLPMASTTKIMTALVALQRGQLTDVIRVPRTAFNYESDATVMGLRPGQVVTLRVLLYGLLLPSGADAANTIAIHYGGSEAGFVSLMNQEAAMLGMRDTHYVNAHGLTAPNHYSSAYDLAVLAEYVSYLPDLMKIVGAQSYTWQGHMLVNANKVLFWYRGLDGIKPGYTYRAGICQVLDARRGGRHIVVVLLHTPDLVIDARNLLNFGLRDFSWQNSDYPGDTPSLAESGQDRDGLYEYYPASGHYLRGKFRATFDADGGLQALGFPRTEPLSEGRTRVQYFQNGALEQDSVTGAVRRLPIGLASMPGLPTPTPIASRTPTSTQAAVNRRRAEPQRVNASGTQSRGPAAASTPTVRPATPTATPIGVPDVAPIFMAYQRAHRNLLGGVVAPASTIRGYPVQIFAYGALIRVNKPNAVMLLPLGDRLLAARGYLPGHPGDTYPVTFAPKSVLRAIGWVSRSG